MLQAAFPMPKKSIEQPPCWKRPVTSAPITGRRMAMFHRRQLSASAKSRQTKCEGLRMQIWSSSCCPAGSARMRNWELRWRPLNTSVFCSGRRTPLRLMVRTGSVCFTTTPLSSALSVHLRICLISSNWFNTDLISRYNKSAGKLRPICLFMLCLLVTVLSLPRRCVPVHAGLHNLNQLLHSDRLQCS